MKKLCALIIFLFCFRITTVAQDVLEFTNALEQSNSVDEFTRAFGSMIDAFHAGKITFKDEEVLQIVRIARAKPFSDNVLSKVYGWAGTMFGNGRMDQAIQFFMESAQHYEKQKRQLAEALSYFQIALIQQKAENFEEAKDYYQKTLTLGGDSLDHRTRINCLNGMALIQRVNQLYDSAAVNFRKAYHVAVASSDTVWVAILAGNIGSCHFLKQDYDSSLFYYRQNLRLIRNSGEFENEIETYIHLSNIYQKRNDLRNAKTYLDSAVIIIDTRKINFNDFFNPLDDINESYARLYAATGDYKKAFQYYEEFHRIAKQKQETVNGRSLKQLQSVYAFHQKENEYHMLEQSNESNLTIIRQQRYIGASFVFIILLLTVITMITVRTGKQRKDLNKELFRYNTELERLNDVKDKLFSVIGHDLRGPINSLNAMLVLLKEGHLKQEELSMLTGNLSHQLEISGNVLENLLHWAKAQLSEIKVLPQQISPFEVLATVLQQLKAGIVSKKITLQNDIDPALSAWADPHQVEIILRNLVGNAIKFTHSSGLISITARRENDMILITIEDNGVGLTEDDVKTIFKSRIGVSSRGTNQEKGTGIGLFITREMIESNGGKIWVESKKNVGTRFIFTLPAPKPDSV